MAVGDKILSFRKSRGWSQRELAKAIGTSGPIIGRYERGEMTPSVEVAKKLAKAFNVTLDYLADATDNIIDIQDMEQIQYISDHDYKVTGVIVPIELWKELLSEKETAYLLKSETMKKRLLKAKNNKGGIPFDEACQKLGI